ncbi:uncharacterized protein BX664DRAFT_340812 [Halteromyces radiatus]|uniref:uncharacterized protein n=1 Tax=Halteromyces radiatus TaxID=101107 RepID=UPI00221E61F8|nr:uncharacterized protein BX664DRAFT_340812 [Halteromyces radiatus]KAI8081607.1 hypothetical protein BX664DRAFT_340812 [Halteromyces radiatus]
MIIIIIISTTEEGSLDSVIMTVIIIIIISTTEQVREGASTHTLISPVTNVLFTLMIFQICFGLYCYNSCSYNTK